MKVCARGLLRTGRDLPVLAKYLAVQVGVTIGASSTDSELAINRTRCLFTAFATAAAIGGLVGSPAAVADNDHYLRRGHPNRLMRMFLRCGSNAGGCPGCHVKKFWCLRRRRPTRPEPQTGRNNHNPSPQVPGGPLPWISFAKTVPEADRNHAVRPHCLSPMVHRHPRRRDPVESQGEFGRPGIATDGPMKAKAPAPRQSRCGHMPSFLLSGHAGAPLLTSRVARVRAAAGGYAAARSGTILTIHLNRHFTY